jgi:putative ATP-binding cassette transporter
LNVTLIGILLRFSPASVALATLTGMINGACYSGLIALVNTAIGETTLSKTFLIWSFVTLCLILPLSRVASEMSLIRVAQQVTFDLRIKLCRQILAARLRDLESIGAPSFIAALTDDISTLTNAIVQIPIFIIQLSIVVGCLVYMGWLSLMAFGAVFVFLVLALISYQLIASRGEPPLRRARQEQNTLFRHLRALTEGVKELKLHRCRREAFLNRVLQPTAATYQRQNIIGGAIYSVANSWGVFLSFALFGFLLFALPQVNEIDRQILTGYTITLLYLVINLSVLFTMPPVLSRASIALKNLESLGLSLSASSKESEHANQSDPEPRWESLELIGVTHLYHREMENSAFTLGPLDLSLRPGEMVFLVGGNGSGKTTLAKLIAGLYVPLGGEIRFNGQSITDENRDLYRQYFTVVFSDFFLFDSLLGLDSTDLTLRANAYLAKLQLDHKVQIRDGMLSTTELSQGQRKRLALLTGYLEDRPIYIFDEWASDQDPLFKEIFYFHLLPELKARGKAVVVISHDDRYYNVADRIIKLDYGQLVYDQSFGHSEVYDPNLIYNPL